jgi:hypothetical protein
MRLPAWVRELDVGVIVALVLFLAAAMMIGLIYAALMGDSPPPSCHPVGATAAMGCG